MSRFALLLVCLVFEVQGYGPEGCKDCGYRIRRSKNYYGHYGPSQKFYKPPPNVYPVRGPFSYTPPPGYGMKDGGPPPNLRHKVSKNPTSSGLGEEDLNNIVKYLSKQDLDKIIELAREKKRYSSHSEPESDFEYDNPDYRNKESRSIHNTDEDFSGKFNGYRNQNDGPRRPRPKSFEYNGPNSNYFSNNEGPPNSNLYSQAPLDTDESVLHHRISPLDEYIEKVIADDAYSNVEDETQGEWSPQPMNDFEIAFTNISPNVVNAESSYKLENFAELPLMDYDSKLDTVNSYSVPHYTITSHSQNQQTLSNPLELANQQKSSVGLDQSDAHLTAIKIWTHKSKGAAYTLRDDGTLTPERPIRPKF